MSSEHLDVLLDLQEQVELSNGQDNVYYVLRGLISELITAERRRLSRKPCR